MTTWSQKTVLVTGAASGIGKAQCEAFLELGATVIGVDCQPTTLQHSRFYFHSCDITDETQVQELARYEVDILCNTAGVLDDFLPSLDTSLAVFDHIMAVNVRGTFLVTNTLLPQMIERKNGVILHMASIASVIPGGGGAAYTMSKHAILGYMKQLVYDYGHDGIRINAIGPGAVNTPMNAADFEGDGALAKAVAKQVPQQRYAEPKEVAHLTVFLASDEAQYICGDFIPIDGGWVNRNIPIE